MSEAVTESRPLTAKERHLIQWMLEHGSSEAKPFLAQLDLARVTSWKCPCGCASLDLVIDGHPLPAGGLHVIADFMIGNDDGGIFVWEQKGVLAGLELYGLAFDAQKSLPAFESLRPLMDQSP